MSGVQLRIALNDVPCSRLRYRSRRTRSQQRSRSQPQCRRVLVMGQAPTWSHLLDSPRTRLGAQGQTRACRTVRNLPTISEKAATMSWIRQKCKAIPRATGFGLMLTSRRNLACVRDSNRLSRVHLVGDLLPGRAVVNAIVRSLVILVKTAKMIEENAAICLATARSSLRQPQHCRRLSFGS
ncbi:hypothetical protein FKP32DRAFT_1376459 [Trametes sanguinea]|nr:hypothetical protein FKP32DRAFT_1376459 [Trametes sanguinea]